MSWAGAQFSGKPLLPSILSARRGAITRGPSIAAMIAGALSFVPVALRSPVNDRSTAGPQCGPEPPPAGAMLEILAVTWLVYGTPAATAVLLVRRRVTLATR